MIVYEQKKTRQPNESTPNNIGSGSEGNFKHVRSAFMVAGEQSPWPRASRPQQGQQGRRLLEGDESVDALPFRRGTRCDERLHTKEVWFISS